MKTPIAFLIFNRPDTTERVFDAIRRARPAKLLVVADGPRQDRLGEEEKCLAARAVIEKVDWPCEVMKNYSDKNLGCRKRVSSGLDWVFDNVDEAIILEDDCLPDHSFFRFCEELLHRYRNNERILMISGTNIVDSIHDNQLSYYYSKYPHIWGWASWRRAWILYDVHMTKWPELRKSGKLFDHITSRRERLFWMDCFDRVYTDKIDTWDAQVTFMSFYHDGLTVFPCWNLVSNIGFGANATHTRSANQLANLRLHEMLFPLRHPINIIRHVRADELRRKIEYTRNSIFSRMIGKAKRILSSYLGDRK